MVYSDSMDFLPDKLIVDGQLYSEAMDKLLSETARQCKSMPPVPRNKFKREKFLEAIGEAFEQIGGVSRFSLWADKNETEFYKIAAKTIPQSTMLDVMGKLTHYIRPALPPSALDGDFQVVEEPKDESQARS